MRPSRQPMPSETETLHEIPTEEQCIEHARSALVSLLADEPPPSSKTPGRWHECSERER